jgi:hypothetical protein
MQEEKRKLPLSRWEIVCLAILTPIVYWRAMRLLIKPMNEHMGYWFYTALGLLVVLGFDIVWVIMMKLWPLKNAKVKIVLTVLVLTLSASVISCWILLNLLSGIS